MRRQLGINLGAPTLIRIGNDLGIRRARTHRFQTRHIIRRAQLDLQQRPVRMLGRRQLHLFRCIERQGKGRDHRPGLGQVQHRPNGLARHLGRMIPKRTIQRIARRTGWQFLLQITPPTRKARNLRLDTVQRLAVARIGDTFTPPARTLVLGMNGQHLGRRPRPARNGENLSQLEHIAGDINLHDGAPSLFQKYPRGSARGRQPLAPAYQMASKASTRRSAP